LFLALAVGCGQGGSGTGGGSVVVSDPARGVYAGTILDESGQPVSGALVSVDGIAAMAPTDAAGRFQVADASLATVQTASGPFAADAVGMVEIAVMRTGYDADAFSIVLAHGERAELMIRRSSATPILILNAPAGEKIIAVPEACSDPRVLVEGHAKLARDVNFRQDVIIVVDRSGSTAKGAFDLDGDGSLETILDAEAHATRCLLTTLDPETTRVALVQFNDAADVVQGFTSDLDVALDAVATIDAADGGTNFEAAYDRALELFAALEAEDATRELPAAEAAAFRQPLRSVVFLSDGIPTSHGVPRDRQDSNLTQSQEDRLAAIEAARALGDEAGARVYAFNLVPDGDVDSIRTTLPHCVAVCGQGHYKAVGRIADLEAELCARPLDAELTVSVANLTLGGESIAVYLRPDGSFSTTVPVSMDVAAVDADGVSVNEISATLTAYAGDDAQSVTRTATVRLIGEGDLAAVPSADAVTVPSAPLSVLEAGGLVAPTGVDLAHDRLESLLLDEYEDAVRLPGVETFRVVDPAGDGGSVTLQVDFVLKESCYRSDFGYIVIDPENPPATAAEALATVTEENVFFRRDGIGQFLCSPYSIAPDRARVEIPIEEGTTIAFFMLVNRRLADYRANPDHWLRPLFSIDSLNPGGFRQAMSFYSARGRTETGASEDVITEGPATVVAFENNSIARWSDQNFTDVVFSVTYLRGRVDRLVCGE